MSKYAKTALLPRKLRKVCTSLISPLSAFFSRSAAERSSILRMEALNLRSNSTPVRIKRRERIHSSTANVIKATTAANVIT